MSKRNVYKLVEADTLVPTATEDICAWWYSKLTSTLWRFDEESETWVQAITGGGGSGYVLPTASATVLGGIKVGDGLKIDATGVLSLKEGSTYELPIATSSVLGGVKVGGTLTISNGVLNIKNPLTAANSNNLGGIKLGYEEDENEGLFAVKLDSQNRAYVQVTSQGGGITEIPLATTTKIGGFQVATTEDTGTWHYVKMSNNNAYVITPVAEDDTPGGICTGFIADDGRAEKDLAVQLNKSNQAYITLPDSIITQDTTVKTITWNGNFNQGNNSTELGNLTVTDTTSTQTQHTIYTPIYIVNDTTTGLSVSGYNFILATASGTTQGTVKSTQSWDAESDTISSTIWEKWYNPNNTTDNMWYYKTLEAAINNGRVYFRYVLPTSLITNTKSNIDINETSGKINLNITYTPYSTASNPTPKAVTIKNKEVAEHIADLYKTKATIDSSTGWIDASQLPDGFYNTYIMCYAVLDDTGKGKIYSDAEHTQKITPNEGSLYYDLNINQSYRYVGETENQYQFVELSKELIYTSGSDNVEITSKREIKVTKATGEADTYVTEEQVVMPIRRVVQNYNSAIFSTISTEFPTTGEDGVTYYGDPTGGTTYRLYEWNAETSTYEEIKDEEGNIVFDNDVILYLTTPNLAEGLLNSGAKANDSYTVIAPQLVYSVNVNVIDEESSNTHNISKAFARVFGINLQEFIGTCSLFNTKSQSASFKVKDYTYSQSKEFYNLCNSYIIAQNTRIACYKWLRKDQGSTEDRLYDTENYYKVAYILEDPTNLTSGKQDFMYVIPQAVYYESHENSAGGLTDAYTSVEVGNAIMPADGESKLTLIAGDNITLTPDADAKSITISAIEGGQAAVSSVNGKTGTVVLTAEDVNALPDTTTIPTKTSELTNDSGFITENAVESVNGKTGVVTLEANDVSAYTTTEVDTIKTDLETSIATKQNKLIAGTNITIDETTNTISATGGSGSADTFKTIAVDGQTATLVASGEDTLTLLAGANITYEVDDTAKSLTINSTGGTSGVSNAYSKVTVVSQNVFDRTLSASGEDTLVIRPGANIDFTTQNSDIYVYTRHMLTTQQSYFSMTNEYPRTNIYTNTENTTLDFKLDYLIRDYNDGTAWGNITPSVIQGTFIFINNNTTDFVITLPTKIAASGTGSAVDINTISNYYGSTTMTVPAGKQGIVYVNIYKTLSGVYLANLYADVSLL